DSEDNPEVRGSVSHARALTVKLRGRAPTPARRRGRTISSSARGAKQEAPHGPLQRLLDVPRTARALPNLPERHGHESSIGAKAYKQPHPAPGNSAAGGEYCDDDSTHEKVRRRMDQENERRRPKQ